MPTFSTSTSPHIATQNLIRYVPKPIPRSPNLCYNVGMSTFAELLRKYIARAGITDAELARNIGVRRQTIFRWKEGIVARPRHRKDVISLAKRLRLSDEERDELLIVAGFAPESMPTAYPSTVEPSNVDDSIDGAEETVKNGAVVASNEEPSVTIRLDEAAQQNEAAPADTDNEVVIDQESIFARLAWTKLVPIGILLLLIGGTGYWLVADAGPSSNLPEPASTRSGPPLPAVAIETETLLLTALFKNYSQNEGYNVAGRIEKELAEQIDLAGLKEDTRTDILYREIFDEEDAQNTLAEFNGALLIWGEYDSGRVLVNFTTRSGKGSNTREKYLLPEQPILPIININVPNESRILAQLALGEHFLAKGEPIKAKTVLEKALLLEPPADMQKNLYFQLGRAYVATAQYEKSIDAYTQVLTLSPATINAHYNRGLVYYERFINESGDPADLDQAIVEYNWMLKRNPQFTNAYLNRGIAYYSRKGTGDLAAAETDFSLVAEKEPDSYRAFYNRGLLDILQNNATQWEPDLLRAKELAEPASDDYVNTLVALCWGYMLEKEFKSAQSTCEEALEIAPERGDSHDSMGIVHALNGDFDAAIEQFGLYLVWLEEKPEAYYERYNGPLVEEWIAQLEVGEQPITDEVLESLRG